MPMISPEILRLMIARGAVAAPDSTRVARPVIVENKPQPAPVTTVSAYNAPMNGNSIFSKFAKGIKEKYFSPEKQRTLAQVAVNFIPGYEQFVDAKDMVVGALSGDKEQMNSGVLGMAAPLAGKAVLSGVDYVTEKLQGKEIADYNAKKRNDLVNMSDFELMGLFKKYGHGGYDQWVKEGKPSLTK
jgi:hypothetical protein